MFLKTRSHTHLEELCIFLYWLLLGQIKQKGIKANTRSILRTIEGRFMLHPESEPLPVSPLLFIVQLLSLRSETGSSVHCHFGACPWQVMRAALLLLPSEAMSEWLCAPQAPDSRTYSHCSISKSHNVGYCCFWSNVKEKAIWMERNGRLWCAQ